MNRKLTFILCVASLLLASCAVTTQEVVTLRPDQFTGHAVPVGVVMTKLPKVDTQFPGAGCLLCLLAASTANSSLTTHTHTLSSDELPKVKDAVAELLRKRGAQVVVIAEPLDLSTLKAATATGPNIAKKNFGPLKDKYKVEELVVIDVTMLGIVRHYSSYFPTGDPQAQLTGSIVMINLATNGYDVFSPLDVSKSAEGAWSEPPNFPGLTNAYYQVVELSMDAIKAPFGP